MILIFSHTGSERLSYIIDFIFLEVLHTQVGITTDINFFLNAEGIKINYTDEAFEEVINIGSTGLLFETGITKQDTRCFTVKDYSAFYETPNKDFSFDIFSAAFFLISRYEEYLPHQKDMYGRFSHEASMAFRENFLQLPLVNRWIKELVLTIQEKYPAFQPKLSAFSFLPTYDIDIAYSYKHKGLLRNIGGAFKHPSLNRFKVLAGLQKDPYDAYDWLDNLHDRFRLKPIYFFLMADKNGQYDKNILPEKKVMKALVKQHEKLYEIGIHPSWQSGDNRELLMQEKKALESMSADTITASRQHYIRFTLPDGYRRLIDAGITDDYSMGYGSINGFRASLASSFYWFDLEKNEKTLLRIHPFCFMEANSFYEQKLTASATYQELLYYIAACKNVNGKMITIWHNNFLGTGSQFAEWRNVYEDFIRHLGKITTDD